MGVRNDMINSKISEISFVSFVQNVQYIVILLEMSNQLGGVMNGWQCYWLSKWQVF